MFLFIYSFNNLLNYENNIFTYFALKSKSKALDIELKKEEQKYNSLLKEIKLIEKAQPDEDYIEELAKEKLNYVRKNEKVLRFRKKK